MAPGQIRHWLLVKVNNQELTIAQAQNSGTYYWSRSAIGSQLLIKVSKQVSTMYQGYLYIQVNNQKSTIAQDQQSGSIINQGWHSVVDYCSRWAIRSTLFLKFSKQESFIAQVQQAGVLYCSRSASRSQPYIRANNQESTIAQGQQSGVNYYSAQPNIHSDQSWLSPRWRRWSRWSRRGKESVNRW